MANNIQSYFRIDGKFALPVDAALIADLRKCPMPGIAEKLASAIKIATEHNVGLLFDMDADTGSVTYAPMSSKKDATMPQDEAIALAAELNHIFKNNPNFYRWPVKLGRGCTVYSFRSMKGAAAEFVTLVLDAKGRYKTSYDPGRNEFYPEVSRLSTKPLAKIYPQILDELNNMYTKVRKEIEKVRNEESEGVQEGN